MDKKSLGVGLALGLSVSLLLGATTQQPVQPVVPDKPTQCQIDLQQAVLINQTLYNDYLQLQQKTGQLLQAYQELYQQKGTCPGKFVSGGLNGA